MGTETLKTWKHYKSYRSHENRVWQITGAANAYEQVTGDEEKFGQLTCHCQSLLQMLLVSRQIQDKGPGRMLTKPVAKCQYYSKYI